MNEEVYLQKSLDLLGDFVQNWQPGSQDVEEVNGLVYCLISWEIPEAPLLERIYLLVYDEDQVIADLGAFHTSADAFCQKKEVMDYLGDYDDWIYLECYTLKNLYFAEAEEATGEILLISNTYVTEVYRRRGIFTNMLGMMKEYALRNVCGKTVLFSCISLDPDIPVFGPDALKEPYYYKYELDEPVRQINREMIEKLHWQVIRLEEDEPEPGEDGTKIWFAVQKEAETIVEMAIS